jgi:RNA polymerase sigma-70 factor (ECF subfamily)
VPAGSVTPPPSPGEKASNDMMQGEFDRPEFLARLRPGDPGAFHALVTRFHISLVRVAAAVIGSRAQAEEVVQDAWLAVFSGISRFQGRSSIVTWMFSIVMNRARTRAVREGRLVGLPALLDGAEPGERAVPLSAFKPDGHWVAAPRLWDELDPERVVAGRQIWQHVQDAVDALPAGQRAVIVLRDLEARSAEEACAILQITPQNQRVLLHRARGRLRRVLDGLAGGMPQPASTAAVARTPATRPSRASASQQMIANRVGAIAPHVASAVRRFCKAKWRSAGLEGPVDRFRISMLESAAVFKKSSRGRCHA